jgi:hypothetical protein
VQLPETWVFWVHTSNAARFEQSFREITNQVKITGRKDPQANIFKLVYSWLQDQKRRSWILILDNIDDNRFFQEAPLISLDRTKHNIYGISEYPLSTYLPLSSYGLVILTMQNKGMALRLVKENDIVIVEPMDKTHAIALFEKKLRIQENSDNINELTEALEFMPLVIVQAMAYIKQRGPCSSVKQYLKQFQKSNSQKLSLLDHKGGQLHQDREAKNSIILTWQISFDHIRQIWHMAADLLSLMSFFDRQGISKCLLQDQNERGTDNETLKENTKNKNELETNISDNNNSIV